MELFHANRQWASRPDDERFTSLQAMHDATLAYARISAERTVPWQNLRIEASGEDLHLVGRANNPAQLTNYAFGQVAARVGAPAGYLRNLPATLAAQNLNRKLISEAYDAVVPEQDGAPNTVWGLAQGITRVSQRETFADERNRIDRAAGKLLASAFKF